jgi:hypothetical protein
MSGLVRRGAERVLDQSIGIETILSQEVSERDLFLLPAPENERDGQHRRRDDELPWAEAGRGPRH